MVLLYVFAGVVFLNCSFLFFFSKFSFYSEPKDLESEVTPISLVVCAKNEENNLKKNIPLWLQQDHPCFEIILINDASSDNTLEVMEQFQNDDSRIAIVDVVNNEAFWGSKKYALTLGIKKAKHERLVLTDADCRPSSKEWLRKITSKFSEEKQIILGYGAYEKNRGFLNKLIRFETLMTAIQYFSFALSGSPYMGVGRNMAYTSKLFYSTNGFMSHMKIASGDDDLFVNEAANTKNTAICIAENAFTYSEPKSSFRSWIVQKKRHVSTATNYKLKHQLLLSLFYASNLLFWGLAVLALLTFDWKIPSIIIGFRILIHWLIIGKSSGKLKENDLIPFLPLLDFFLVLIQLIIFISNSISKPTHWK